MEESEDIESLKTSAWLHNNRIRILLSDTKENMKKYELMNDKQILNEILYELSVIEDLIKKALKKIKSDEKQKFVEEMAEH